MSVLLLHTLAGCNLMESFFDDSEVVEDLLEDARYARAAGDYDRAVSLLERAYRSDSAHPLVRLELAVTLLQRERMSILNLDEVISHFANRHGADGSARGNADVHCTFGPADAVTPFDPRPQGHARVRAAAPALTRAINLLGGTGNEAGGQALPQSYLDLDVCQVLGDDGLHYDRALVLRDLGLLLGSGERVTSALATNAVALALNSYLALFDRAGSDLEWYTVNETSLGVCVAEASYEAFVAEAQTEVRRVGDALLSLDLLFTHAQGQTYGVLVDQAVNLFESFDGTAVAPCAAD